VSKLVEDFAAQILRCETELIVHDIRDHGCMRAGVNGDRMAVPRSDARPAGSRPRSS
jgi:hypothetical protein